MNNIIASDIYRFGKSKLLYGILLLTVVIAFFLTSLIRQDIRLGISVFGNLTAFTRIEDIIRIGLSYHNGLGLFVAVLLSVFIGQEYQWKTWQHKWITNKSRIRIYLSKFIVSSTISACIFLIFQGVVLLVSGQTGDMLTGEYVATVMSGAFIYAALGAVICMLSMLIKNITASIIACLGYVILIETLASIMGNIGNFSDTAARIFGWFIRHSTYGMATIVSSSEVTWILAVAIVINSFSIMLISMAVGVTIFRKYEL